MQCAVQLLVMSSSYVLLLPDFAQTKWSCNKRQRNVRMGNKSIVCHALTLLSLSCLCILPEACSFRMVWAQLQQSGICTEVGDAKHPSYVHKDAEGVKTAYSHMDIQQCVS